MIKLKIVSLLVLFFCCSCKTLPIAKDAYTVKIYVIPFNNFYYAGIRMSTIKAHPDAKITTVQDKAFYENLNEFMAYIDTCKVNSAFSASDDFVYVLLELKDSNGKLNQIGLDHVGTLVNDGKVYYPNNYLIKLVQPYIKEQFRPRRLPNKDK